ALHHLVGDAAPQHRPALVHEAGVEVVCLVVGDPLAVVDTSVQRDVDGEGQESHGEDCMTRLPAGPIAPPAAGIQLQFGPHGYPSSRAGSSASMSRLGGGRTWWPHCEFTRIKHCANDPPQKD